MANEKRISAHHKILIGIDTGVNTGICVYGRIKKVFVSLECGKIHNSMELVKIWYNAKQGSEDKVFVRVEDARLRKWIPQQKNEKAELGRAAGAGSVKRDAQIWEHFLTDLGVDFEMVAPKNNKTKLDAVMFKRITGWQNKTNGHSRDAGMLVFGM